MANSAKLTTIVSTKGQVILPKAVRNRHRWDAGTRLVVEDTADGVLLRPAPHFPESRPADVYASLPAKGKARTVEEMNAGVLAEARRRYARD
jgi:AbrB family looped-hinge helix DNA binding protein